MKILLVLTTLIVGMSAHAELLVVTMPLTETNVQFSKFAPAETINADGLLVRTSDGLNDCLIGKGLLKAINSSAIEFYQRLEYLNSSPDQYLLSCYTESGKVIQAVITKSR